MAPWHCSARPGYGRRGVGRDCLGHRHFARRNVRVLCDDVRRVVDDRFRELEREERVGEMVLDRLEGADGHPELLALLHVVDGDGQHVIGQADELRSRRERSAIKGSATDLTSSLTGRKHDLAGLVPLDREQMTSEVDRRLWFDTNRIRRQQRHTVVTAGDDRICDVRVEHEIGVDRNRDDCVPTGNAGEPFRAPS